MCRSGGSAFCCCSSCSGCGFLLAFTAHSVLSLQSLSERRILLLFRAAQACGDNRDGRLIRLGIIIHSTEDDVGILTSQILYILSSIARVNEGDVTGDIDDDM